MIQGQSPKCTPAGLQKPSENNPPTKINKNDQKLTEKTKFTLQYDFINGKSKSSSRALENGKRTEKAPQEEAQIRRTAKSDLLCPGVQDGQRVRKDQIPNSKFTARKDMRPNKERQIRNSSISVPFIKSSATKSSSIHKTPGSLKRMTMAAGGATVTATAKDSSVHFAPSKSKNVCFSLKPTIEGSGMADAENCHSKSKLQETKASVLKKSTTSLSGAKVTEETKQAPVKLDLQEKKSCTNHGQDRSLDEAASQELSDVVSDRSAKEETPDIEARERGSPADESLETTKSEGYAENPDVPERKCSEDVVSLGSSARDTSPESSQQEEPDLSEYFLKSDKRSCTTMPEKIMSDGDENPEPEEPCEEMQDLVADAKSSSSMAPSVQASENRPEEEDKKLSESSENGSLIEEYEDESCEVRVEPPGPPFPLPPAPPTDRDAELEALRKQNQNYELLNLDKRIWSELEVEIRQTCEKTDFLYESGADSAESLTEMMDNLLSNQDEDVEVKKEESQSCVSVVRKSESRGCNKLRSSRSSVPSQRPRTSDRTKARKEEGSAKKAEAAKGKKSIAEIEVVVQPEKIIVEEMPKGPTITLAPRLHQFRGFDDSRNVPNFFDTHPQVAFIGKPEDEDYISFQVERMTLYQPLENQMLLCDVANCMATRAYLKMCGLSFNVVSRKNAEQMSPSGKVPFIASGLCIIPEFEAIVSFMQYRKFACILVDEDDKPTFRALVSLVMDTLEVSERYICWYEDDILRKYTKPRVGGHYPFPLNHIMNWKKGFEERRRLADEGTTRKSFDLILTEMNNCFRTLSQHLGNNMFFFRNTCTELDALVYGHLYALFSAQSIGLFKEIQVILFMYPNLLNFAVNFDKMYSMNVFASSPQNMNANSQFCGECCKPTA